MTRKSALPLGLLALIPAAVLLLCALFIPMAPWVQLVLCLLSFLAAFFPLALPVWRELLREKRPGYPLLLAAACLIFLFCGRPCAGAGAMLLYRLGTLALDWRRIRGVNVVSRRRELLELGEQIGDYRKDTEPGDGLGRFIRLWLPYILLLLAALVIILLMLLTRWSTASVLRRAAMLLALGNLIPLFHAYGLCDYAAAVNAGEHDALFRKDALSRLNGTGLCCIRTPETLRRGDAVIQSAMPEELPPAALLELAACAWSCSPSHMGDTLAELLGHRTDPELLERYQELRDFGVLARIRGRVVICGSAEFMQRAGLPLIPFKDRENTVHVGLDGKYAGCIRLQGEEPEEAEVEKLVRECGLYRFDTPEATGEGRYPGETLLYASGDGNRGPAGDTDLYAALGGCGTEPEIATASGGRSGAKLVLGALLNDKRSRRLCFLPSLTLKAVLLLLSLLGLCPIWLTVLTETIAAWAGCVIAQQALNAKL